ncbi:hypothetical protein AAHE18_02G154700 [Arachis hypogaea]
MTLSSTLICRIAFGRRIFKELDEFYQEVIDEHIDPNKDTSEEEDIVDVLLQLKKQRSFSFDLTYDHIKAILMVVEFAQVCIWHLHHLTLSLLIFFIPLIGNFVKGLKMKILMLKLCLGWLNIRRILFTLLPKLRRTNDISLQSKR